MLDADYAPIPLPDFVELPVAEMQARATAFYEMIRKRHTVREFSTRPVPPKSWNNACASQRRRGRPARRAERSASSWLGRGVRLTALDLLPLRTAMLPPSQGVMTTEVIALWLSGVTLFHCPPIGGR